MINLIVFGLMVASFSGVVFWLASDRNNYYCARRDAPKKRQQVRQAELRHKLREANDE